MKQDFLFKEENEVNDMNKLLRKGFYIVGVSYNKVTYTMDYHLRRTLLSYLFSRFNNNL